MLSVNHTQLDGSQCCQCHALHLVTAHLHCQNQGAHALRTRDFWLEKLSIHFPIYFAQRAHEYPVTLTFHLACIVQAKQFHRRLYSLQTGSLGSWVLAHLDCSLIPLSNSSIYSSITRSMDTIVLSYVYWKHNYHEFGIVTCAPQTRTNTTATNF